jgi:hypothetical protein
VDDDGRLGGPAVTFHRGTSDPAGPIALPMKKQAFVVLRRTSQSTDRRQSCLQFDANSEVGAILVASQNPT